MLFTCAVLELELELGLTLTQPQMAQKPMLRGEVRAYGQAPMVYAARCFMFPDT